MSDLEQESRRRVWCSTEGAGLMLGVAQREELRSHWSNSCSSSSSEGPPTSVGTDHQTITLRKSLSKKITLRKSLSKEITL